MDNRIKYISKDIRNGRLLEENIPKLFNQLADHDSIYAGVRLAMHYYTFYESYCDEEDTWSKDSKKVLEKVNNLIRDNILKQTNGADREKAIRKTDTIRKEIMEKVDALTAFSDIFQIFEYVLNRVEYRFKEEVPEVYEEEFAKEILRYIFNTEDNLIINERIKDIIGQLPVRITRQRYFDLLRESIQVYQGADKSSLDTYLYMLRTSAMLYKKEGMDSVYPGLWEKKEQLFHMDFKDMTRESYEKANSLLQAATLTLETEVTVYIGLQEIINELYTLLLCFPYAGMAEAAPVAARETAISIIREVNGYFISDQKEGLSAGLSEDFTDLEGVQEEMSVEISAMEDALYEINLNHRALADSLMQSHLLQVLLLSQKLLSGSLFIDLEEAENCKDTVDEAVTAKEEEALIGELSALLDTCDRLVSRAIIANTISKMPVFFKDHKEVMDYVRYSLGRCTDSYEKAACYEIINEMLSE